MTLETILLYAGYIISAVLAVITFINSKRNKTVNKQNECYEASVAKLEILNKVDEYCAEAEQFAGHGNGAIKNTYVKYRVKIEAAAKGVFIDDEEIEAKIETVLTAPQKKGVNE